MAYVTEPKEDDPLYINERFEFRVIRTTEDIDGPAETTAVSVDGSEFTHTQLAEVFNRFLTAAGYSGHDYVNYRDYVKE